MEPWIHGNIETRKHGPMDEWTWRHGNMETRKHGDKDTKTWTWRHGRGNIKWKTENGSPCDFP